VVVTATPSSDILESLARALLLDAAERRHLFRLAAAGEPAPGGGDGTDVRPGLAFLVRSLEPAPAVVLSRRLDLLVCNPTAEALLGPFGAERNYARLVFGDPPRERYTPTGRRPPARPSPCFASPPPATPTTRRCAS
jgi:MmyB-like transcription regulator ligand binding domain